MRLLWNSTPRPSGSKSSMGQCEPEMVTIPNLYLGLIILPVKLANDLQLYRGLEGMVRAHQQRCLA